MCILSHYQLMVVSTGTVRGGTRAEGNCPHRHNGEKATKRECHFSFLKSTDQILVIQTIGYRSS